jgi:hypothetical protein
MEHQGKGNRIGVFRLKAAWVTATVLHDFPEVLKDYGLYDRGGYISAVYDRILVYGTG